MPDFGAALWSQEGFSSSVTFSCSLSSFAVNDQTWAATEELFRAPGLITRPDRS
jgi:hypothetical protein